MHRPWFWGALVMTVVIVASLVAAGWWWFTTGRFDRAMSSAQEAADRVAPGRLRVASAEGMGTAGGYSVRATILDEPDAAVDIRTASGGVCAPGSDCERGILRSLARAPLDAAEVRAALAAFERCGQPVLGVANLQRLRASGGVAPAEGRTDRVSMSVTIPAEVRGDGGAALIERLDRCALEHARARADLPHADSSGAVSLDVAVVDARPGADATPGGPERWNLLGHGARNRAGEVRHRTVVAATVDGVRESSGRWFGPADRVLAAAPAAEQAAADFAAAAGVHPVNPPYMAGRAVYLPGTVTRFRTAVTFRSTTATRPGDDRLVDVDVDLDGSDPVAVRMVDFPRTDDDPGPR